LANMLVGIQTEYDDITSSHPYLHVGIQIFEECNPRVSLVIFSGKCLSCWEYTEFGLSEWS
jgi:hypothetical protein